MENNVRKIIFDVMYKHIKPELDKINEVGDFWTYSSFAGSFDWDLSSSSASSYRYRTLGSCLSKDKKYWKVFNHGSCGEQYNINVHFNDNDKITNVEWIEDSKFDAIDKSIMYSIYEDLKKYETSKVLIVETDNTGTNISKALEVELASSSEEAEKPVNDQIKKECEETMKDCKSYNVGELLWRTTDNALFEIIQIDYGMMCENSDKVYTLKCVNNMNVAEHVIGREPETELHVKADMVHTKNSIYTPFQPNKPKKGQHVWNKYIIGRNKEFIVEAVENIAGSYKENPCKTCHNGVCEQCHWGYRSEEDIAKEIGATCTKPETIYTMVGIDGREQYKANDRNFADTWSMLPPYYDDINEFVKSEMKSIRDTSLGTDDQSEEAEDIDMTKSYGGYVETIAEAIENVEKEAVDTGFEDYYEIWKKSLKVVNIPKFDLEYFTKGLAYHVNKVTANYPGEFHGIMLEATEDLLRVMKLGTTSIHIESTEIIEIPLKEYMNGDWHIVRLVDEV